MLRYSSSGTFVENDTCSSSDSWSFLSMERNQNARSTRYNSSPKSSRSSSNHRSSRRYQSKYNQGYHSNSKQHDRHYSSRRNYGNQYEDRGDYNDYNHYPRNNPQPLMDVALPLMQDFNPMSSATSSTQVDNQPQNILPELDPVPVESVPASSETNLPTVSVENGTTPTTVTEPTKNLNDINVSKLLSWSSDESVCIIEKDISLVEVEDSDDDTSDSSDTSDAAEETVNASSILNDSHVNEESANLECSIQSAVEELPSFSNTKRANQQGDKEETKIVFVGNIPPSITKQHLVLFFKRYGKIVDANFVQSFNNHKRLCFLEFEKAEDALKALEVNGIRYEGYSFKVVLQYCPTFKQNCSMQITKIPKDCSIQEIFDTFEICGPIKDISVRTVGPVPHSIIVYEMEESLQFALLLNNFFIRGRRLKICKFNKRTYDNNVNS